MMVSQAQGARPAHLLAVLTCGLAVVLSGCAGGASSGVSTANLTPTTSSSPSVPRTEKVELRGTLLTLRSALAVAYARGREGEPLGATPATVAALKAYFKTVDPAKFNGASRAVFIWAYPVPREPDGHRSTSTRQYVSAYFWADGAKMVAAGDMKPGLNEEFFRLTRRSAGEAWDVDGIYYP